MDSKSKSILPMDLKILQMTNYDKVSKNLLPKILCKMKWLSTLLIIKNVLIFIIFERILSLNFIISIEILWWKQKEIKK